MASPTKRRLVLALLAGLSALAVIASVVLAISASSSTALPAATAISSATPNSTPNPAPSQVPTATASPAPTKVREPKPASRTRKARNVPELPRDSHYGRRIVYDKALMTVWMLDEMNQVLGRYPVVGRFDRPAKGVYHIFSKSKVANNPNSKVTFNHMMRFTYGPDTKSPIGLHAIPRYYDGSAMHSTKQLGLAIAAGGCVRLSEEAAAAIYKWAKVGDRVIVLPSP